MHGSERNAAPPAGPRYRRHLAEQPRPAAVPNPFALGSGDTGPQLGPEFYATYDSDCDADDCAEGGRIQEGDLIRADGEGGFIHSECAEED
jgi:hypothetical protein